MNRYRKAIVAAVGAVLTALSGTLPPDTTAWRVVTALLAAGTAGGVLGVENAPKAEHRRER